MDKEIKTTVVMKKWSVVFPIAIPELDCKPPLNIYRLYGKAYGHPKFPDGDYIFTSPIVKISDGDDGYKAVSTENTDYLVHPETVYDYFWFYHQEQFKKFMQNGLDLERIEKGEHNEEA